MSKYFIVHLKDGTLLTLDKKCDYIDYTDPRSCIFKHKNTTSCAYDTLAIIPYENINYIKSEASK